MVQRIKHLALELHRDPLADMVVPDQRKIPPRRPIRADAAETDRKRAKIVRELLRRDLIEARIRVEPTSHGLLAAGKLDVLDIAGENVIFPRQRSARLILAGTPS